MRTEHHSGDEEWLSVTELGESLGDRALEGIHPAPRRDPTRPDYYEKWGEKEDRVEYLLHARDWSGSSGR